MVLSCRAVAHCSPPDHSLFPGDHTHHPHRLPAGSGIQGEPGLVGGRAGGSFLPLHCKILTLVKEPGLRLLCKSVGTGPTEGYVADLPRLILRTK